LPRWGFLFCLHLQLALSRLSEKAEAFRFQSKDRGVPPKECKKRFLSPFTAAERGYIDDVIMPHSARKRIARAQAMLRGKGVGAGEEARQFAGVGERTFFLIAVGCCP
jgi:acetyl-CoA carboxylase carboxyltransferase component